MTPLALAAPRHAGPLVAEAGALAAALAAGGRAADVVEAVPLERASVALVAVPWALPADLAARRAAPLVLRLHGACAPWAAGGASAQAALDRVVDVALAARRVLATSPGLARFLLAAGGPRADVVAPVVPLAAPAPAPAGGHVLALGPLARSARLEDAIRASCAWRAAGCALPLALGLTRHEDPLLAGALATLARGAGAPPPRVIDAASPAGVAQALAGARAVLLLGEEHGRDAAAVHALRHAAPLIARGAAEDLPGVVVARTDDPVALGELVARLVVDGPARTAALARSAEGRPALAPDACAERLAACVLEALA